MLSLAGTKAVVLVLMTVLTMAACFLPPLVKKAAARALQQSSMQTFMSACLCFGGGVLLATVFLHLLPETRAVLEGAVEKEFIAPTPYPVAEFIVCLGFFVVYIIEEVVHKCVSQGPGGHSHLGPLKAGDGHAHNSSSLKPAVDETPLDDQSLQGFMQREKEPAGAEAGTGNLANEKALSTLRAVMVVVALSVHSLLEGLALGLVNTNRDVWLLFGALCAHKLIIAFCMSMELMSVGTSWPAFFISLTIFSLGSPLGGLAGTLVVSFTTQTTAVGMIVPVVLNGLSAGTLLYVSFCEILERERTSHHSRLTKMWSLLLGFLFMAAMQIIDSYYAPQDPSAAPSLLTAASAAPFPHLPQPYGQE